MITGNLYFGMTWEAYKRLNIIPVMAKRLLPEGGISDAPPIKVRVNHGRWLIDCECSGAELAFNESIFMCMACCNGNHKHQYRRLVFPKNRRGIEMELIQRPEPNRNWYPGETLAKLKADNELHKAELLEVN